jgi:hypothetical protein
LGMDDALMSFERREDAMWVRTDNRASACVQPSEPIESLCLHI